MGGADESTGRTVGEFSSIAASVEAAAVLATSLSRSIGMSDELEVADVWSAPDGSSAPFSNGAESV